MLEILTKILEVGGPKFLWFILLSPSAMAVFAIVFGYLERKSILENHYKVMERSMGITTHANEMMSVLLEIVKKLK